MLQPIIQRRRQACHPRRIDETDVDPVAEVDGVDCAVQRQFHPDEGVEREDAKPQLTTSTVTVNSREIELKNYTSQELSMQAFIMHVGSPGYIDIDYTVTRKCRIEDVINSLPNNAPEKAYFQQDKRLHDAFPSGTFNCWGIPGRAEPSFEQTKPGDLVLFIPRLDGCGGGVLQLGIVKTKCPIRAHYASKILWPKTPHERPYPLLLFFETEVGKRPWANFLDDLGYAQNWNPRGWYRRIGDSRFSKWKGPQGYLHFLREQCGFSKI